MRQLTAVLSLVAMLWALPAHAGTKRATDAAGSRHVATETIGALGPKGFSGPPRPSWRTWVWIGVGIAAVFVTVKLTIPSK